MKLLLALAAVLSGAADPQVATPCACIFDIDRTLTGKQGAWDECPRNIMAPAVDYAYNGGALMLSELAQAVGSTFCHQCFLGTISAGDASGTDSQERDILHRNLTNGGLLPSDACWSDTDTVTSPLVVCRPDGLKQTAVPGILAWYKKNHGVEIPDENVYFFDDRVINVESFKGTPYNAKQISCATRDMQWQGGIGLCGAQLSEIVPLKGAHLCPPAKLVAHASESGDHVV